MTPAAYLAATIKPHSRDALHEPAHQQLMQLYAWAGQQTTALRQYQEYVRIFVHSRTQSNAWAYDEY